MPSFEYTAIDRQGRSVQGQVQAATRDEAAISLTRTGLLVSRLDPVGSGAAPQSAPPRVAPTPTSVAGTRAGAPPVVGAPPTPAKAKPSFKVQPTTKKPIVRTKRGTDKDLYFIFSQLQSFARAGINPVEALTNLGNSAAKADYRTALLEAADAAKEGKPISDVFERYVDLFPPHVVGMVRAAEHGGFFPEAYDLITDQAHASHKFRIWFVWLLLVAIMVAICIPGIILMARVGLRSWDVQEQSGGQAPGWGTFYGSIGHDLIWPTGPLTVIGVILVWLFSRWWQSLPRRPLRHRLTLLVPTIRKRARAESLSVFAWSMGMLSRVGLAPRTVWELSVGAVPNLEVRRQLEETAARMGEQTKLSDAMLMTSQLPEEYAPIVKTGEVTGDVPGALLRASQTQLEEFKAGDQASKLRVGCWMFLLLGVGSAIMMGMYYKGFFEPLMHKIVGE